MEKLFFCSGGDFFRGAFHSIYNQLLGTDRSAQAAGIALAVIDNRQIPVNGDGILGADLDTDGAANAALCAATNRNRALGMGSAGNAYMLVIFHRNNDLPGADLRTGHAALCHATVTAP